MATSSFYRGHHFFGLPLLILILIVIQVQPATLRLRLQDDRSGIGFGQKITASIGSIEQNHAIAGCF